jgi:hypothetical protein
MSFFSKVTASYKLSKLLVAPSSTYPKGSVCQVIAIYNQLPNGFFLLQLYFSDILICFKEIIV